MKFFRNFLTLSATACALAACPIANASLTIFSTVGGAPTGVTRVNFDNLNPGSNPGTASGPNGSVDVSFLADGGAVKDSVSGRYAMPYLSGGNGAGFGENGANQLDGQDGTIYLTSGISTDATHGQAILTFSSSQQYLGLLWGSVDDYNTLSFYDANDNLIGAVTGSQVLASPSGNQGLNGTVYVNINSDTPFTKVVATSTQYAFEFDNVAYNSSQMEPLPVPEPTTVVAGLLLLLPFGASAIRMMRKK